MLSLVHGQDTAITRFLSHPLLRYLGAISYSIYLWHYPLARLLRDEMNSISTFALTAGFAIAVAAVSYHLIERPLKAFRHRQFKGWMLANPEGPVAGR